MRIAALALLLGCAHIPATEDPRPMPPMAVVFLHCYKACDTEMLGLSLTLDQYMRPIGPVACQCKVRDQIGQGNKSTPTCAQHSH